MRELQLGEGRILHLPDHPDHDRCVSGDNDAQPTFQCWCHKRMGNDFWFLPIASCIRGKGATCDHVRVS